MHSACVLQGTENGTIGCLDVGSHEYSTLLRSHTKAVHGVAVDAKRREITSVSDDGTIRVWNMDTTEQGM